MTNSGNDYHYNLNITNAQLEKIAELIAEKLKPVRDERSEESAVIRERTRIIKVLEGLKQTPLTKPFKPTSDEDEKDEWNIHCGKVWGFNQALDQAIKAVGERSESAANEG